VATGVDGFLVVTLTGLRRPASSPLEAIAEAAEQAGDRLQHPQRVVLNLEPGCSAARQIDNVTAVKPATTDLDQATRIVEHGALISTPVTTTWCCRSHGWAASAASALRLTWPAAASAR
jgi:dihydrodipicolinate synthase/N-acetylneuraminate lyase